MERRIRRRRRVRAKIAGTARRPRLTVFRSNKHWYAQLVDDETGTVLAAVSDRGKKTDAKGVELAKTLGAEIAKVAKEKNVETLVFDRGGYRYHGGVRALAEEVRQHGIVF